MHDMLPWGYLLLFVVVVVVVGGKSSQFINILNKIWFGLVWFRFELN